VLLSGNIGASLLGLISLALTAKALPTEQLGSLVLALSIVTVVDKLSNFQSWQAYIKYSTDINNGDIDLSQQWLYRFCLRLDGISAIAGSIISITLLFTANKYFELSDNIFAAGVIFSVTIATNITGTYTGVLRLAKQYQALAKANIIAAGIKLILVSLIFISNASYLSFCIAWAAGLSCLHIVTIYYGIKYSPRKQNQAPQSPSKKAKSTLLRFIIASNLQGSVKTVRKEGEVLLIGALLGTSAVAIYKIARQISQILARLTDPILQTLLPTIAEILVKNNIPYYLEYRKKIHLVLGATSATLCLLWWILADWLIALGFTAKYQDSALLSLALMIATSIYNCFATLPATLLAKGKANTLLKLNSITTALYFIILPLMLIQLGVEGAGITAITYQICWFFLLNRACNKLLKL